jgi:molecular chaperone DnaK (HSP70)
MNRVCLFVLFLVSAGFGSVQRNATLKAAELAGIEVLELIPEPTAAALAFLSENANCEDGLYLSFDFGGGTHDVCLLAYSKEKPSYKAMAVAGDNGLGGRNIDNALFLLKKEELLKNHNISLEKNSKRQIKFKQAVVTAKTKLEKNESVSIEWEDSEAEDLNLELTQQDMKAVFDKLCLRERLLAPVRHILNKRNLKEKDLKGIIMVGGSAYLKCVQDMVRNEFKSTVRVFSSFGCCVFAKTVLLLFPEHSVQKHRS